MREAKAGRFPAKRAVDALRYLWTEAIGGEYRDDDPDEFDRLLRDAIAAADADGTVAELWARAHGTDVEGMSRAERALAPGGRWHPDTWEANLNTEPEPQPQPDADSRHATRCLADVEPVAVTWLWKGWLPSAKVSLFEGDSDVGKSTVTIDWATTVTTGRAWPASVIGGKTLLSRSEPANVLLVGVEDADDDTVVPRLMAAGADLNRVRSLERPVDKKGNPVPFTIPDDIDWLGRAVTETNAKLVVIDPITACLPDNAKHGIDASIRRILMCLVDLARETGCAIVLTRHFNKAHGMSAKHRGGGSVAYSALVRSVISAGELKEPAQNGAAFAIARAVGNLSKPPATMGYTLEDAPKIAGLPEPEDDQLRIAVVRWCGPLDMNADQLVGADGAKVSDARKNAPLRDECENVLRELLSDGPMRADEAIKKVREVVGCSVKPVKEAAKHIEIVKKPVRIDTKIDHWTWEKPPTKIRLFTDGQGGSEG